MADEALEHLSGEFDRMYSEVGRAAVPPERLLESVVAHLPLLAAQRAGPVRRSGAGMQHWTQGTAYMEAPGISP